MGRPVGCFLCARQWTKARELFKGIGIKPEVQKTDDWLSGLEDEG